MSNTLTGGSISYSGSSSPSYSGGPTAESYTYTPSGTDGTTVNSTDSPSTISTDSKDGSTLSLSTSRVKAGETVKAFATLTTTKEPEATETLTLYATETNSSSKIISQSEHTIQNGKEKTVSSSFSISTPNEYIISASLDGSGKIHEVGTLTVVDDSNYSVSNISMTPSDPTTDDELTFTADITNSGSDSGTTTVEFFEGGDAFVSKEVSVGASSTKTVSGSYTPSEEKVYNFHIGVVEPAIIKEVSEVYIGDPTPVSVSVSESSDFVQPETEVTLNVDSSSHSDSDVSIVEYTWSIGDESATTDSTSYSTTLNTEKVYEYTVTAIASNGDTGVDNGSIIVSSSATSKVSEPHTSYKDVPLSELDGSGTEADPYVITNDWELDSMKQDTRAHYVLGNDIDASGTAKWDTSFKHIVRFHGTLDGKGHEIIGPHIRRTSNWAGKVAISGLIRELDGGTVRNIGLRNPTVIGDEETGGLVGYNYQGTIKNAYVIGGDISGGNNDYTDGNYSAGIVGKVSDSSTVSQVYSTASADRGAVGECYNDSYCTPEIGDHIYWNTDTAGSDAHSESVGLTTSEMKGDSAKTNMSGLDFKNTWKTVDGGYPVLQKSD